MKITSKRGPSLIPVPKGSIYPTFLKISSESAAEVGGKSRINGYHESIVIDLIKWAVEKGVPID